MSTTRSQQSPTASASGLQPEAGHQVLHQLLALGTADMTALTLSLARARLAVEWMKQLDQYQHSSVMVDRPLASGQPPDGSAQLHEQLRVTRDVTHGLLSEMALLTLRIESHSLLMAAAQMERRQAAELRGSS